MERNYSFITIGCVFLCLVFSLTDIFEKFHTEMALSIVRQQQADITLTFPTREDNHIMKFVLKKRPVIKFCNIIVMNIGSSLFDHAIKRPRHCVGW
jgi:hypothetical protein